MKPMRTGIRCAHPTGYCAPHAPAQTGLVRAVPPPPALHPPRTSMLAASGAAAAAGADFATRYSYAMASGGAAKLDALEEPATPAISALAPATRSLRSGGEGRG